MIDYFALAMTHALILIAVLRVLMRDELDREDPPGSERKQDKPLTRKSRRMSRKQGRASDA